MIGGRTEKKQRNNCLSVVSSIGGDKRFRKSPTVDYTKITYLTEYLLSGFKNFFFPWEQHVFLIPIYLILVGTPILNI